MRIFRLSPNLISGRSVSSLTTKEVSSTSQVDCPSFLSYVSYVGSDTPLFLSDTLTRRLGELDPHGADQVSSIDSRNDAEID